MRWRRCSVMPGSSSLASYLNDGGARTETLARSLHLRCREALGEADRDPSGLYPGDYLKPVAAEIAARDGDRWLAGAGPCGWNRSPAWASTRCWS